MALVVTCAANQNGASNAIGSKDEMNFIFIANYFVRAYYFKRFVNSLWGK